MAKREIDVKPEWFDAALEAALEAAEPSRGGRATTDRVADEAIRRHGQRLGATALARVLSDQTGKAYTRDMIRGRMKRMDLRKEGK